MNTKRFFVLLASLLFVVMVLPPMIACPDEALAAEVKYRWKISPGQVKRHTDVSKFC